MNRVLCLVILAVCLAELVDAKSRTRQRNHKTQSQVVGGKVVDDNDAPWQVAVMHRKKLICGGSLLRKNVVLTAAECIKDLEPAEILVRGGSKSFQIGGQLRKVRETIHHPDYDEDTRANNVAILHLIRAFNSSAHNINSIKLPEATAELPITVSVYGWGSSKTKANFTLTKNLRKSKEKVYSVKKCSQYLADDALMDSVFCTGDRVKRVDICNDDLGSPAVSGGIQYGVVSESNGCSKETRTTLYTNVIAMTPWIVDTLEELKTGQIMTTSKPKTKKSKRRS